MKIGDQIRALRRARKMTQEQLAEYLNISSQAVSKWECGTSTPDADMLPRLAVFFGVSMDELFDFDRTRVDREVEELVRQSLPLRADPGTAEAFYREALKRYPNNEVLLNCLLMCISNERIDEKLRIGRQLLDCTQDDEIKYDVLRLLSLACHEAGQQTAAENYLSQLPELYFLKTEVAAAVSGGEGQLEQIGKTERTAVGIFVNMLALRASLAGTGEGGRYTDLARALLELLGGYEEYAQLSGRLTERLERGELPEF